MFKWAKSRSLFSSILWRVFQWILLLNHLSIWAPKIHMCIFACLLMLLVFVLNLALTKQVSSLSCMSLQVHPMSPSNSAQRFKHSEHPKSSMHYYERCFHYAWHVLKRSKQVAYLVHLQKTFHIFLIHHHVGKTKMSCENIYEVDGILYFIAFNIGFSN